VRFLPTFSRNTFLVALIVLLVAIAYAGYSHAAQLTITWTDNSDNEFGFKIERRQGATGTFNQIATVGPDITSYTDFSLTDETTYCYRVRAFNGSGDSDYTNEDCAIAAVVFQTVTVSTAGNGSGTVTSIPGGISCGADCTEDYEFGKSVTLTATPITGSVFAGWSSGGCSGTGTCTLTVDADLTVTATFDLETLTLTAAKTGSGDGTLTSASAGINCGADCTEDYEFGQIVTLTATPATGSLFAGWSGGGCGSADTCMFTINASTTVTAMFNLQTFPLTVTKTGSGDGTLTSQPTGINCNTDCTEDYEFGKSVTLTATPITGSVFAGWSSGGCSGTGTCTVTVDSAVTVAAAFDLQIFTLTVTQAGSGNGMITNSQEDISCGEDCSEQYTFGTSVTLIVTPNPDSSFKAWSGACTGAGPCTVTMSANNSVSAIFSKTFTDDPLISNVTFVKAIHFTDALEAINTLRSRNGLGNLNFTALAPTPGVTILAMHMTDLQTGLNAVYDALGRARPTFDSIVSGVTLIGRSQMEQIRNVIRALE